MTSPGGYEPVRNPSFWSRALCFLGFHPYEALTDLATCGDCGRFVL